MKKFIIDNTKTLIFALIIAVFIRSILIQPFYIPSSSMEPNLLVGDRLFVTKFSYGYSKHSFPFSPPILNGRVLSDNPERGDNMQFIDGDLYLKNNQIVKTIKKKNDYLFCGNNEISVSTYEEKLPNGKKYFASYRNDISFKNSDKFIVPKDHYFFLGDNRDCSKDSRFLSEVGYVHKYNLVGKAQILFFSSDPRKGSIFLIWKWNEIMRFSRLFKKIK